MDFKDLNDSEFNPNEFSNQDDIRYTKFIQATNIPIRETNQYISDNENDNDSEAERKEEIIKTYKDKKEADLMYKRFLSWITNIEKHATEIEIRKMNFQLFDDQTLHLALTEKEIQKLTPNLNLKKDQKFLKYLGIEPLNDPNHAKKGYSLNVVQFIKYLMQIVSKTKDLNQNLDMIFEIYDLDSKGEISKKDLTTIIAEFQKSNKMEFDSRTINNIVEAIFKRIENNNTDTINKEQMKIFLQNYGNKNIEFNPFKKELAKEPTYRSPTVQGEARMQNQPRMTFTNRLTRFTKNMMTTSKGCCKKFTYLYLKTVLWLIIYISLNIYLSYEIGSWYFDVPIPSLKFAKFFTGFIHLNGGILLILVCFNFWTLVGKTFLRHLLPIEDLKLYHQISATVFFFGMIGHIISHLGFTFPLVASLSLEQINQTVYTPLNEQPTYFSLLFQSIFGITGIIGFVCFTIILALSSFSKLRNWSFETFWYFHKLFYIGLTAIGFHGYYNLVDKPIFWRFIGIPAIIFVFELLIRLVRLCTLKTKIESLKFLPSGVIELKVVKPKSFSYKSGTYAQINIPEISCLQWHPFTIASSEDLSYVLFYIAPKGWWTTKLKAIASKVDPQKTDQVESNLENEELRSQLDAKNEFFIRKTTKDTVTILLDGPYGAPAQNYTDYENLILVASGVGATPFISMIISLLVAFKEGKQIPFKTISFYWVLRSLNDAGYLKNLFEEINRNPDARKLININLFITSIPHKFDVRFFLIAEGLKFYLEDNSKEYFSSKICANTFWGRPSWDSLFAREKSFILRKEYLSNKEKNLSFNSLNVNTGVFVCGNMMMANDVYNSCTNFSDENIKFHFFTEHF